MIWRRALRGLFSSCPNRFASGIDDLMSKLRFINSAPGLGFFSHSCTSPRHYHLYYPEGTTYSPKVDETIIRYPEVCKAVETVLPSVVSVILSGASGEKVFSGFVVDADGTILTSSAELYPIKEYLSEIKVDVHHTPSSVSGRCTFTGAVSYVDFFNAIAIVNCTSDKPLPAARIGTSRDLRNGDMVVSITTVSGPCRKNPFQFVVEPGFIRCESPIGIDGGVVRDYMFTFSPASTYGVGLPVVNLKGEVVGVHCSSEDALSVELVCQTIEFVKKYGRGVQPWLGVDLFFGSIGLAYQGVLVCEVSPGSPADQAGIYEGDIIMEIDGQCDLSPGEVGTPLEVNLNRVGGYDMTLTVVPNVKEQAQMRQSPFI